MTPDEKRDYMRRWRARNPNYLKEWRTANPEREAEYLKRGAEASKERAKQWRVDNKAKCRQQGQDWRGLNPERARELNRNAYHRNPEAARMATAAWRAANPEKLAKQRKEWLRVNRAAYLALAKFHSILRRRLVKAQAIAKHYRKETQTIYAACPEGHQVDHIVPLRGKLVSGLHVPWNLQYLPALENLKKGNKFEAP